VGSGQWAVGSGQWTVDSGQWTVHAAAAQCLHWLLTVSLSLLSIVGHESTALAVHLDSSRWLFGVVTTDPPHLPHSESSGFVLTVSIVFAGGGKLRGDLNVFIGPRRMLTAPAATSTRRSSTLRIAHWTVSEALQDIPWMIDDLHAS